ncbi:glycosyl hydrolase [Rhizodiscina lignyota]|uniref:Glycosyl hydrolase n=1 Tax=Rhizodiscina lignyota TaxID=1504668 RepID=A0A9P4IEA2_9PEZI|nr:glycosyl hydrolase [Rhizodiscina lignyota]
MSEIGRPKRRFRSYRLKGDYERPWTQDPRMKKTRMNNWIVRIFIIIGVALSAFICYTATWKVGNHKYCLILDEDFHTLDTNIWSHEVQIDGFGVGSFDWDTTDPKNSFVDAEGLHIVPTLTNETTNINDDKLYNGYTLNLTKAGGDGSCTGTTNAQCSIHSNSTLGSMIPPVRSARLTTKGKKTIKYGRVEVTAKMPEGDWLWPAIWMMPEDNVYGVWPRSGEIDIAESRGNDVEYPAGGRDVYTTTLHWGPTTDTDAYWRTTSGKAIRRTDYTKEFHTFGLEWSRDYLYFYLDTRLVQIFFIKFGNEDLWTRGDFASMEENSTLLQDPWEKTGQSNTPFDQPFYLILNVAVGARNGFFPDNKAGKPWLDDGASSQWDFYHDADNWLPTWGEGNKRGMTVKSVKMWQEGACTA